VAQQEDRFWQAHVRIAYLLLGQKNGALARTHLDRARALRPDAVEVLYTASDVGIQTKDWELAISALKRLSALQPAEEQFHLALAEVYRQKGDWKAVYDELRPLRLAHPKDLRFRPRYALAAFRAGKLEEAAAEFEDLAKNDPQAAQPYLEVLIPIYIQQLEERERRGEVPDLTALERALDRMQPYLDLTKPDKRNLPYLMARRETLARKKDWKGLAGVLELLLPFMDAAHRGDVERMIAAVKAGQVPGEMPAAPMPPPSDEDRMLALIERCLSPEVGTRRAALQEFYEVRPGWVPKAVLLHFHPAEEPDAECRAWVVKLVGTLEDPMHAKIAGHALQDPDGLVRRVAAEVLATIGTPAGILYLYSYLPDLPLAADAPERVVQEYNAARLALVELTRFDDVEIGAPRWIPAAGLAASRKRWETWFASPDGVLAKRKGIEDLGRTGETHPEWYLLLMVWDASPEVAKAAYDALLERSTQPTDDPVAKRFWPSFPRWSTRAGERDLTPEESLADVKVRIKAWWTEWLTARHDEAKTPPAGAKPAPASAGSAAPGGGK
jgi:tetratricopeptide (TPR) repeat protein